VTRPRRLLLLVLAMPVLLVIVIASGEINRRFDRSEPVDAELQATGLDATPLLGPRLHLEGELLREREVTIDDVRAGEDLYLRFRRGPWRWELDSMRRKDSAQAWSAETIDIPARVFARGDGRLLARPLLPQRFAISRELIGALRRQTIVEATLRRGATGSLWIETASTMGDPIGEIAALIAEDGKNPRVVVSEASGIDPRARAWGRGTSWLAGIENGLLERRVELPSPAVAAVQLTGGDVMIALRTDDGRVSLHRVDRETGTVASAHTSQARSTHLSLEADGSWWSVEEEIGGGARALRHRTAEGELLEEYSLGVVEILSMKGGALLVSFGPETVLLSPREGALVETDRWAAPGRTHASLAAPDLSVVATSKRVAWFRSGVPDPLFTLPVDRQLPVHALTVDPSGAAIIVRHSTRRGERTTTMVFVDDDYAVYPLETNLLPGTDHPYGYPPVAEHLLVGEDQFWLASRGALYVFSRSDGRLLQRIDRFAGSEPRRLF
jgi:hypothetical protein